MRFCRWTVASLLGDKRGNVAIIFALSVVPMIGLIGLGSDYALAMRSKAALDAAVDAAALAAITTASQVITAQSTSNYDPTSVAIAQGQAYGQQVFLSDIGTLSARANPNFSVTLARSGAVLTATATYTAQSQNMIGSMFGSSQMALSGIASSNMTLPKYVNVYMILDISQSMGIADTSAGMSQLFAVTANTQNQGGGCVFGCHVTDGSQTITNEVLAHNAGIQLRIDSVRQSTINMINTAQNDTISTPLIKIGLYTMQSGLVTLASPSSNFSSLATTAQQIDLGPNNSSGVGDSNQTSALATFAAMLPTGGDGSGPNSPMNYVFILTDGVQDNPGSSCTFGHCTSAFNPALCTPLKAKNATVGVIYTTYLPLYNDGTNASSGLVNTYAQLVYPFSSQIAPNMQSCSSSGYYYEASNGTAIDQAIQTMFASAVTMARLTQ